MQAEQSIINKLNKLEQEVKEIKEQLIDPDSIMTEEDYEALLDYREQKKTGKLINHEQLKKELGI